MYEFEKSRARESKMQVKIPATITGNADLKSECCGKYDFGRWAILALGAQHKACLAMRTNIMAQFFAICVCLFCFLDSSIAAPVTGVYPSKLNGTISFELGDIVLVMMPPIGQRFIGWDWQADSPIQWQSGFTQNPGAQRTYRDGFIRVNVMGKTSTVLKQRTEELAWTVELYTDGPAKFGPAAIRIEPGLPGSETCFGTLYEGCTFDPRPSLASAGIKAILLCQFGEDGRPTSSFENATLTYAISAPKKQPILLQWVNSGGSGGSSSAVILLPTATPAEACKPGTP